MEIDASEIWSAYARNLDRVLPSVESLIDDLDGRTVVTSDHGNMIDERAFPLPFRVWGHPERIHLDRLITIPWLVNEGDRREVVAGRSAEDGHAIDDSVVDECLEALGYR